MKTWAGKDWNPESFYKDLVIFDNLIIGSSRGMVKVTVQLK